MDKRMRRARINALSTLMNQLVSTGVGIVIPWIMIDYFGSEAYGATTSIAQFLAYIALFEGGIGRVARGALYGPLAVGNKEEISRIYLAVKRFFAIVGAAFVGYTLILAVFYYDIAKVTVFDRPYVFALVLAIAVSKFAEYMWGISNVTLLNADQRQYVVNAVYILSNLLNVVAICVLVNWGADLLWVKLASSAVFILKPLIFMLYVKGHYAIKKSKTRALLKNKATGIAQHVAYVVQNSTDVLILTVCADLKYVAVYSVYHLITFSLRSIVTSFTGGMEAVFGDMIAKGEQDELKTMYEKYKLILTILVIAVFGTAAILIVPFVKLYTEGTTDADYVQPIFALLMVVAEAMNCLTWPCFNLTIAANKLKESRIGAYGEAAINIVVSLALVFWNPLVGIAIGTLCSAVFKSVYYIVFSGKRILHMKTPRMLGKAGVVFGVLLTVSFAGIEAIRNIELYNYSKWIVAGLCIFPIVAIGSTFVGGCMYPSVTKHIITGLICSKRLEDESIPQKGKEKDMYEEYAKHDIEAYAGYLNDNRELLTCSSGGVATALSRYVIEHGGYVAGVTYTEDYSEACYKIADQVEQLEKFKGSKYIEVNKGSIYRDVQQLLNNGKTVLFFGLPCTVAGLRSFLKKDYDTLITVDLICHGPTSAKVHRDYVDFLQKKYDAKIVDFSVKKKMNAWIPGYLYAKFDNGETFVKSFYHTEYGYAFSVSAKNACYSCKFRGNNRTGDLMIGDFWGATENDEFWNKDGVSSILVHTEKGSRLLHSIDNLSLYKTTFERIVEKNQNIIKPRAEKAQRHKFDKLFIDHDLFYSVKHSKSWKSRIKAWVKRIYPRPSKSN